MANFHSLEYGNLIQFVRGGTPTNSDDPVSHEENQTDDQHSLTGAAAKAFYESLTADTSQASTSRKLTDRIKTDKDGASVKTDLSDDDSEAYGNETLNMYIKSEPGLETEHESCNISRSKKYRKGNLHTHEKKPKYDKKRNEIGATRTLGDCVKLEDGAVEESGRASIYLKYGREDSSHNKMLTYCQNGELKKLKKLMKAEASLDINYQDRYGWTALMCAAVANNLDIVEFLLQKGANKYVQNSQGETAADLAHSKGATYIRDQIYLYTDKTCDVKLEETKEKFCCEICKCEFEESTEKQHSTSTVHLFNMKLKPKPDSFMISEANVGYRLMKQSGWDGEKGLGPEGQGQRFPVKTSLKRDRSCLGSKQNITKKVTHFGPNDTDAVKSVYRHAERRVSARVISRREERRRANRDKQWERNLRQYMNSE